jgi:quinol-cytochrome oxidoreductase complex cytochrome b subunit
VNLTQKVKEMLVDNMSLEDALPTKMPTYVNSVAYLFGVLTLSSLVMLLITGPILAIFGPDWYHMSPNGKFVNSMHFWSTQVFFVSLLLHLATKFFMGAWRDGRWKTWMVGALTFAVAVFTALTGFLSQTNWDSQWIAVQAKDAMNAVGVGSFFNTMNIGQVLTLHVSVLPIIIVALVLLHIFLVRRDGPVKPMPHPESWVEPSFAEDMKWIAPRKRQTPKKLTETTQVKSPAKKTKSGAQND